MIAVSTSRSERLKNLAAVTAALAVASLVHGFSLPLLSLVLAKQGIGPTLIGFNAAAQYLAVLAVVPFAPRLMTTVGPVPLMLWSVLATALLFLVLPLFPNVYAWFPLRFLLGIAASFIWIGGEVWINHMAEEGSRGRTVALYGMAVGGGFAVGPFLLAAIGVEGWTPFVVAAAVILLASLPLLPVWKSAPKLEGEPTARLIHYLLLAPVAMGSYFVFSATDAVLLSFFPIYGVGEGLAEPVAIRLISVLAIGAIVFQLPVGWLMDHANDMWLTLFALVGMGLACMALPWVVPYTPWNALFMFAFGGVFAILYTLPLVMLGRRFKGADLGAAATVFSVVFCLGSAVGPPVSGFGMSILGNDGMRWTLVLLYALAVPLPVIGLFRRWRA